MIRKFVILVALGLVGLVVNAVRDSKGECRKGDLHSTGKERERDAEGTQSDESELFRLLQDWDRDGDGHFSFAEVKRAAQQTLQKGRTSQQAADLGTPPEEDAEGDLQKHEMVQDRDRDGDGQFSVAEVKRAAQNATWGDNGWGLCAADGTASTSGGKGENDCWCYFGDKEDADKAHCNCEATNGPSGKCQKGGKAKSGDKCTCGRIWSGVNDFNMDKNHGGKRGNP